MTWQKTSQVKASLLDAHAAIQVLLSPELELKALLSLSTLSRLRF